MDQIDQSQDQAKQNQESSFSITDNNLRLCVSCGLQSLQGMPGGRDSICQNCGYKDPCCYD